jgi:hypothetical protein
MGGEEAFVGLYRNVFPDGRVDLIGVEYSGLVIFWRAQNRHDVTYTLNLRESAADIQAVGVNLEKILANFPDIRSQLSNILALRIGKPTASNGPNTYDLIGAAVHLGERVAIIQGKEVKYRLVAHVTKAGEPLVGGDKETGLAGVNEGGQIVTFLKTGEAIVTEEGPDGGRVSRTYTYDQDYNVRGGSP